MTDSLPLRRVTQGLLVRQARILPLLGPAAVLYLIADVASAAEGLSPVSMAVAAVALLVSLAPVLVRHRADAPGERRVGVLGVALGVGLVAGVGPDVMSLAVDLSGVVAFSLAGGLLLDLSVTVPDAPRALDRGAFVRAAPTVLGVAAGVAGLLGVLPPPTILHETVVVPAWWALLPVGFAAATVVVATVLRALRRRMGSTPEALAASSWALLGLVGATLVLGLLAGLLSVDLLSSGAPWTSALGALAVLLVVVGHGAMVDSRRRVVAGPATRALVASAATLSVVGCGVGALHPMVPREPLTLGLLVVATLLLSLGLHRVAHHAADRFLAPDGGRLLSAIDQIAAAPSANSLDGLSRGVLPPLRLAAATLDAEPLLLTLDPGREVRIDAAAEPHVRAAQMPEALAERLAERPGEVIVRDALEGLVVRRPPLRPLVSVLVGMDALCVVPLSVDGETEGALVVPRGRRRGSLSLEEIAALEALGRRLSVLVGLITAQGRGQLRAGKADTTRKDLEERVEHLEEELERARSDAQALSVGRDADRMSEPPVAYGTEMRGLLKRVRDIAPLDGPVLLVAPPGAPVDRVGHVIHTQSGCSEGAFVVADCGSVRREALPSALFGEAKDPQRPGWLRLAAGGSLLLLDVPALPIECQRDLSDALGTRQARPVAGQGAYPVDVRLIATSRVDITPLVEAGVFDSELGRWLGAIEVRVPALRERMEDLPSMILLALDQACRALGREPVGIEKAAQDVLLSHDWPGDERELQWVIERAVSNTDGPQVTTKHLPPLVEADAGPVTDPLEGTYADIERRVLSRALEHAGGNKSEAARALGLKRTTFLDKLRRHGLSDQSGPRRETAA